MKKINSIKQIVFLALILCLFYSNQNKNEIQQEISHQELKNKINEDNCDSDDVNSICNETKRKYQQEIEQKLFLQEQKELQKQLHNLDQPKVQEYNLLSSSERWDSIPTTKYTSFTDPMLSDKYQYEAAYAFFLAKKHNDHSVFELFFRSAPFQGQFAVFAGVEEIMSFFKYFKITESHIAYLKQILPSTQEDEDFYEWLRSLGPKQLKVSCQKEGSIVFPKEPLIVVEGPLGLIKLLEAPMISLTSFPTLVATNAARMRSTMPSNIKLFEYGLRRAQGSGAALIASRSSYLGGFDETSSILASRRYNIPLSATHSHAFVTAFRNLEEIEEFSFNGILIKQRTMFYREKLGFSKTSESELAAFLAHARAFPESFVCLVDSFDSITSGIPNCIIVAFALMDAGFNHCAVRLDSGNLAKISIKARALIDNSGRQVKKDTDEIKILVSNRIGEKELKEFASQPHEIDIFAIETELVVCEDQPHLGMVFKLVENKGEATMKFSEDAGKSTLPGRKALYRVWVESSEHPIADVIALPDEKIEDKDELDVVVINQTQQRYTIMIKKVERILHLVIDNGELVSQINFLDESKRYLEEQKQQMGNQLFNDENQYMVVVSENYWNYFQKSAQKSLIPKIIH